VPKVPAGGEGVGTLLFRLKSSPFLILEFGKGCEYD